MKALELARSIQEWAGVSTGLRRLECLAAAAELRRLAEVNAALVREMGRYLPVINRAEDSEIWGDLTDGTGIATANGYRAALVKAKEQQ